MRNARNWRKSAATDEIALAGSLHGIIGLEFFDDFLELLDAACAGDIDLVGGDGEHLGDLVRREFLIDIEVVCEEGGFADLLLQLVHGGFQDKGVPFFVPKPFH